MNIATLIRRIDDLVWGPWLLFLLLGTGIYLMLRLRFLPLKNLKFAFIFALGGETEQSKSVSRSSGQVSALSSLTTELAATMGTGNIVGVEIGRASCRERVSCDV